MRLAMKVLTITLLLAPAALVPHPSRAEPLITIDDVIKDARAGVEFLGNEALIRRIQANPKLVLLDVRTQEEYLAGHLKGATWMERGVAEFRLARTLRDRGAEIVVYCGVGNRSALVVKALKRLGYKNVRSHVGFNHWVAAGHSFFNLLGEAKMVKLQPLNAAMQPVDYYQDKR
jgi:rhodanese-related sulfurtransferase